MRHTKSTLNLRITVVSLEKKKKARSDIILFSQIYLADNKPIAL